ncbi:hypothetical protein EDF64_110153 [Curtobacterium flaccumfaciens]|uniref:Uncharacterized protein n=1 Tax=Curtobacterium flaccumfaciens TaxID=2035 RepID=A0A4V3BKH9_9MICO|nr:hypothetical protein EDF64_110153 [Curtobacterium flaccumfaciens]
MAFGKSVRTASQPLLISVAHAERIVAIDHRFTTTWAVPSNSAELDAEIRGIPDIFDPHAKVSEPFVRGYRQIDFYRLTEAASTKVYDELVRFVDDGLERRTSRYRCMQH